MRYPGNITSEFNFTKMYGAVGTTLVHLLLFINLSNEGELPIEKYFSSVEDKTIRIKMKNANKSNPTPRDRVVIKTSNSKPVIKKVKHLQTKTKEQSSNFNQNKSTENKNSGQDTMLAKYLSDVQKILEKNKFYPVVAKRMGQTGIVRATFTLENTGRVLKVSKIESSFFSLKSAVDELITKRAKFPKFPEEVKNEVLSITIPIIFEI